MRLPRALAWVLVGGASFTAGLLRRFHDETPRSPFVHPAVGSLLFAGLILLILAGARERALGPNRGAGVRLGTLTPLMLMLFLEKWVANTWYAPLFAAWGPASGPEALVDARFRAFAGGGLLVVCALLAGSFPPVRRRLLRAAGRSAWTTGFLAALLGIAGCYALLGGAGVALGQPMRLATFMAGPLMAWTLAGQALLALGEEGYYRGLLLFELQRIAPRLGVRRPAARRWLALVWTSALFALEHFTWQESLEAMARRGVFTFFLGMLLGIAVLAAGNVPLAALLHAFTNWAVLGAVPLYTDETGGALLPPGVYIGLALSLAFVALFALRRGRSGLR